MKKVILSFATFALALASAAETHRITLYQDAVINGKQLKAGDYKMQIDGSKAVISKGKESVEANVTVESNDAKFSQTAVRMANAEGKFLVKEIRVGGTKTKVVFPQATQAAE